jgi:hypothetical protein
LRPLESTQREVDLGFKIVKLRLDPLERVRLLTLISSAVDNLPSAADSCSGTLFLVRWGDSQPEKRKVGGSTLPLTTNQLATCAAVIRPNVFCCWICSALLVTAAARSRPSVAVRWGTRGARHMMLSMRVVITISDSSSRSQVAVRTARAAVRLIWERPSVNVHPRLVMDVPIVTQLVTRLASESVRGFGPGLVRGQVIPCLQSMAKMSSTVLAWDEVLSGSIRVRHCPGLLVSVVGVIAARPSPPKPAT